MPTTDFFLRKVRIPVAPGSLSRRSLLLGTLAGALAAPALRPSTATAQVPSPPWWMRDPFTLGVASGDPTPTGVVLWTRLAPRPLSDDGLGGMTDRDVQVQWQVATDERFRSLVRSGTTTARREFAHSVHVEVDGLLPGRDYFYRFRAEGAHSPAGRTRTTPPPASMDPLVLAFASCSQYEHGYFTAYRRLAEEEPDLVLHLGDYQYEFKPGVSVLPRGNVRDHRGPETVTLANYRQRHAQYKADPDLQAAHAAAPWVVVPDDHEVENNWAGDIPEVADRPGDLQSPDFRRRRAAAFRAYYENMPLRSRSLPQDASMQLFRRLRWGRLATFHMLDTRQYRSDQACGDGWASGCEERLDPARTMLGPRQEEWLLRGLARSEARWDLLGQQVFFSELARRRSSGDRRLMDAWDGYAAARDRVVGGLRQPSVRNPVVLTGDLHYGVAADVRADFADPGSPTVAAELICTSISSGGDGADTDERTQRLLADNPHLRFSSNQRGYVRARLDERSMQVDYRVLPYVSRPGAPVSTRASFVVEDRRPGVQDA